MLKKNYSIKQSSIVEMSIHYKIKEYDINIRSVLRPKTLAPKMPGLYLQSTNEGYFNVETLNQ